MENAKTDTYVFTCNSKDIRNKKNNNKKICRTSNKRKKSDKLT